MQIITSLISFLCLILAITVHEFCHALVADHLGDPTPRSNGRLTLNPLAHADPIGTLLLPLFSAISGVPTIGWAKPVPIDPFNFQHPKRDEIIVSLAGPASNLLLAIIASLVLRFLPISSWLIFYTLYIFALINISLSIFNLIPIPPLDGSHVFLNILPEKSRIKWEEAFSQYGFVLLIILVLLPINNGNTIISSIMTPIIQLISSFLLPVF
jgi:Zn-dependent protease